MPAAKPWTAISLDSVKSRDLVWHAAQYGVEVAKVLLTTSWLSKEAAHAYRKKEVDVIRRMADAYVQDGKMKKQGAKNLRRAFRTALEAQLVAPTAKIEIMVRNE